MSIVTVAVLAGFVCCALLIRAVGARYGSDEDDAWHDEIVTRQDGPHARRE
ncbi:hypothetical protein OG203_04750 [Nocardia sp. NBC_01499]|uniref:hypothetical protein n=1 Tax=Nocardia sp. NBC_01499 TaxID=2903597 RepID=UPI003870D2CE